MLYNSAMGKEKSDKRNFSSDLVALFFLVAMVLWFNDEIVRGGKVPFFRDLSSYFYPMRLNLAESLQAGELPLWNRRVSMGFPFLANLQAGVFYPPHLTFLWLPFFDAIRFLFVFHYLTAATGAYFLCRRWNYLPYLALIGGILFAFGGVIVSLSSLMDHFQTAVWLPWVLLLGERCLRLPSGKNFLLFTSVLLVQFLAGSPEIYAMSLGLFFLDGLRFKAEGANVTYGRFLFLLLAANALVAGLAMVQILPTIELFQQSWRSETIPYVKATAWSLNPLSLVNLFFLDKEVNLDAFNGLHLFFTQEPPFIVSLYIGAISLSGVCLWLFNASLREIGCLLGLIAIFLTLAMGDQTPVYLYLHQYVPLLGLLRFPEKFLFIASALVLFIALTGLFRFLRPDPSRRQWTWVALALPVILIVLIYLWLRFHMDILIQFIARARQSSPFDVSSLMIPSGVIVHLERQIALTFGIFLLLFLWKVGKLRSAVLGFLLVGIVFIDVTSAHRPYGFLLDPKLVYQNPRIISAPDPEPYRIFYILRLANLHPNAYAFTKRPFNEIVSSVYATLIPNTGVFYGFDYMQEMDPLGRKPYNLFLEVARQLPPERLYRLLGALNVRYVNSFQPLPKGAITPVGHFPEYPSWLYRIDHVIPRSYIVPRVIAEKEPSKILHRLASAEFDPLQKVILEEPQPMAAQKKFAAQARITRYTNQNVVIQTALNGSGILVLADSYYPGWRVYVDGKEQEIRRANLFFRGVPLSAGKHVVEFRYEPRSFTVGLSLSLLSLAVVTVWSIFLFISRKKK